jgi:dihydrofolate synthase/folylpolyglutamate synthase
VFQVLTERSANNELVRYGIDFELTQESAHGLVTEFSVRGRFGEYSDIRMPILGSHQAENAATAIAAVESFFGPESAPGVELYREAFSTITSPGRLQVLRTDPLEVVDGAHNPAGARSLLAALEGPFFGESFVAVIGMFADKAVVQFLETLLPRLDSAVFTQVDYPRAMPASQLAELALQTGFSEIHTAETPAAALALARRIATESDSGLLVTGSLYLAGAALEAEEA